MTSRPTVSVITIFLNEEKFIQETIESVFAQNYDHWELLLVDDGSTDMSTAIARRYAAQHPATVSYLAHDGHENRGMSAARNLGIKHAEGKYIAFLDGDDVWLPETLQEQVAILESWPEAGAVYGSTQYWHSWTGQTEDMERDYCDLVCDPENRSAMLVDPPDLITRLLTHPGKVPCLCSVLMHRDVLNEVGGSEENFRNLYEDQALYVKIGIVAPVVIVSNCWAKYRQHPDSSCAVGEKTGQSYNARLYFLTWLVEHLQQYQLADTQVAHALEMALWPYRHPRQQMLLNLWHRIREKVRRLAERTLLQMLLTGIRF